MRSLYVFLFACLFCASACDGKVITVDDDGPADFNSIESAVNSALDGDTVLVRDGLYRVYDYRPVYISLKRVTVRSENGPDTCVIDCEGLEYEAGFILLGATSVVDGFTITNNKNTGLLCKYASHLTLSNCRITASGRNGVSIADGSEAVITKCFIGGNNWAGILIYKGSAAIEDCVIAKNSGGILVYTASNAVIESSIISRNYSNGGIDCSGQGSVTVVADCLIKGNSHTYAHSCPGIAVRYAAELTVVNCTISGNLSLDGLASAGGIAWHDRPCIVTNSVIYDNWGPQIAPLYPDMEIEREIEVSFSDVEGGWEGIGNIDVDPGFIGPGHWDPNGTVGDANDDFWIDGDYHLRADSPCVNAGDHNFDPEPNAVDIDGEKRVMLDRIDVGADEFNPFTAELVVVNKKRIDRNLFEYECEVVLKNVSTSAVEKVRLEMAEWSVNMTIIDPDLSFADTEIGPGDSVGSIDTCKFLVDRSKAIDPHEIIWHSTALLSEGGASIQQSVSSSFPAAQWNSLDFEMLRIFSDQWLQRKGASEIDKEGNADGVVNFIEFARLAGIN